MNHDSILANERAYFESVPWCAALLRQPGNSTFVPTARLLDDPNDYPRSGDVLMRQTLRTEEAIPHCIGIFSEPSLDANTDTTEAPSPSSPPTALLVPSASVLFSLRPGVNGFSGAAHGGLVTALMDETMGSFLHINHKVSQRAQCEGRLPPGAATFGKVRFFTAGMDVKFRKPIWTPREVLVTASLVKLEGRRLYLQVVITAESGIEHATCDGVWAMLPGDKL